MSETTSVAGVTYTKAGAGYFEKRTLKRTSGFWGLWGIGVAAVISGDFSGWNFGIGVAGWGGMLIATVIITGMFLLMISSIGEMAAAMPHTGGAYSFARAAMGPWGGFVTGLAETIEYVMTTAVVTYFSAGYADAILFELTGFSLAEGGLVWVWWVVLYAIFLALNSAGANASFTFAIIVAVLSVAVLAVYAIVALASGALDFSRLWDIEPTEGNSVFLPFGVWGIVAAMPFAIWLYLGIEELPLAAEESHNPARDIPKAGFWGLMTLVVTGAIVLFLNPGVLGSAATGAAGEPLLDGFRAILPGDVAAVLSAFALIGLLASLQGIMFAYGRNVYSLSRAGYYPKFLSLTGRNQTPWVALLVGGVIGIASLFITEYGGATAGAVVLNIAVWGASVAYILQMTSYIILRRKFPRALRPYRSPYGVWGAGIAGAIAVIVWIGETINPAYTPAIITTIVIYVVALALFALFSRKRLVLSPEEEYALSGGLHGDPQKEGYDAMEGEVFGEKTPTP